MNKDVENVRNKIREICPSKNNSLYNSNMYWSQKPYNICDLLIEELSEEGEVVFDPFMGSGVTVLEALRKKYNRVAIGCEINEAPIFIVEVLLKNYNLDEYRMVSSHIIKEIKKLEHYYYTKCEKCGEISIINNVLFDLPDRFSEPEIKNIKYKCPNCGKSEKKAEKEDYKRMLTQHSINNISIEKMHENSKLAVYKDETIDQIFTKRNFSVLDEILEIFKEYEEYRDVFEYILMSVLHLCKITDTHSNSQWPLWIPKKNCVEKNIIDIICKKIKKFEETIQYLDKEYSEKKEYLILNKGSQFIDGEIIDESVSLIITDPPYLGQVAYSEYMQLYKPFIGKNYNTKDEIIVTSTPERKISQKE